MMTVEAYNDIKMDVFMPLDSVLVLWGGTLVTALEKSL